MVITLALTLYWMDAIIGDVARLWWGPLAVNYLTMLCIWVNMYCMDRIAQPSRRDRLAWDTPMDPLDTVIAWESARMRPSQMIMLDLERRAS
jgi:hypothetical protein